MKLYYAPGACSLSPHIVINEAGLSARYVKVDLKAKKTESGSDFLSINPKGYVPTLELDEGAILTEGPAIVQYLADQVPQKRLVPAAGTFARYRLQEWLNFISTELHKGFGPLFYPPSPEVKEAAAARLLERLRYVNDVLKDKAFVMGDDFTVADAYLFTVLGWARFVSLDLAPLPALGHYIARVAGRPAVQKTLQEEGLLNG